MRIVNNIRKIAKMKKVKIMDLENGIGVAYGFFSRVENRGKTLTYEKIENIARFLGISPLMIVLPESTDDQLLKLEELITGLITKTYRHEIKWKKNKTNYEDLKIELKDDSLYIDGERVITKPVFETELSLLTALIERKNIISKI